MSKYSFRGLKTSRVSTSSWFHCAITQESNLKAISCIFCMILYRRRVLLDESRLTWMLEVNWGQRQKDRRQNKALGFHLKKRKQGGVIMICATSISSFFISSTWKLFSNITPSPLYALYTKSLQNITIQLYTENIPQ